MRLFLTICLVLSIFSPISAQKRPVDYVNPFIGTDGHGHTFPGATIPFGMVQLSPDTRTEGWDAASGYHYSDSTILGFSHTHLNGTGVNDFCDILLTPSVSGIFQPLKFQHKNEQAQAGYYKTVLDENNIEVELTSSERVGFHRYKFSENVQNVTFFLHLNIRNSISHSRVYNPSSTKIEGNLVQTAWAKERVLAFSMESNVPSSILEIDTKRVGLKSSLDTVYRLQFDVSKTHELLIKVALSPVSEENASKNMQAEIPHWDFDKVRKDAENKWSKYLNRIQIEGGTEEQRHVFYTALYHTLIHPSVWQDVNGDYRGLDNKVHNSGSFTYHSIFSLWDTYRGAHPLYTIICPEKVPDFINGFIDDFEKAGHLPVWNFPGNETWCMIGNHSIPVITDAYLKGFRGFDAEKALNAMIKSVNRNMFGLKQYREKGYIPADTEGESVSKTLEYAFDDYCIAQMAKAMKKEAIYKEYIKRSQNWENLFNPKTGFFQAKSNETFLEPFEPREVNHHFTEGNAWQYIFAVQHDVQGLITRLGGKRAFEAKLDTLFSGESKTVGRELVDITGLIGQYAHGNEPSHHVTYLYNYVNRPDKTANLVRKIMTEFYKNAPDGLIGNEDCGQMSAWYVLSAMSKYPVNPCYDLNPQDTIIDIFKSINLSNELLKIGEYNRQNARVIIDNHKVQSSQVPKIIPIPYVLKGKKLFKDKQDIELACVDTSAMIYYTTDGSDPRISGTIYSKPIEIIGNKTIKFVAKSASTQIESSKVAVATFKKIVKDKTIQLKNEPSSQYPGGAKDALVDGEFGIEQWQLGGWQGFEGVDLEAVVDLGKAKTIRSVILNCVEDHNAWIFAPSKVEFYTSMDNKNFTLLSTQEPLVKPNTEGGHIRRIGTQKKAQARYIKVVAKAANPIPNWHKGAGGKGWLFADEIIVE